MSLETAAYQLIGDDNIIRSSFGVTLRAEKVSITNSVATVLKHCVTADFNLNGKECSIEMDRYFDDKNFGTTSVLLIKCKKYEQTFIDFIDSCVEYACTKANGQYKSLSKTKSKVTPIKK